MKFLKRRIGQFYPYNERTKWWQEFTGFTIQQLLWIIPRLVVLTPLLLLTLLFEKLAVILEELTDTLDG
jgi:hypothetical protein